MILQRVVVPVDGTDFSCRILPFVTKFVDIESAEIVLLRVVTAQALGVRNEVRVARTGAIYDTHGTVVEENQWLSQQRIYDSQARESAAAQAKAELGDLVKQLGEKGVRTRVEVLFDDNPADAITAYIQSHPVDLLAITTHGRKGLSRQLLGSVTEAVIREVGVPVLLMHPCDTEIA